MGAVLFAHHHAGGGASSAPEEQGCRQCWKGLVADRSLRTGYAEGKGFIPQRRNGGWSVFYCTPSPG